MRRRILLIEKVSPIEHHLRVTPVSAQWITITTPITYEIESDVDWIIE